MSCLDNTIDGDTVFLLSVSLPFGDFVLVVLETLDQILLFFIFDNEYCRMFIFITRLFKFLKVIRFSAAMITR